MSENLSGAFDAPLIETIGGVTVKLPLLTMEDLALWGREIQNAKKLKAMAGAPLNDMAMKQRIQAHYDEHEPDVDEMARHVGTIPGARFVLVLSMTKGGMDKAAAQLAVIQLGRERGWQNVAALAAEASALFAPRGDRVKETSPNAPAGESATGDSIGSLSPESVTGTPAT